MSMSMSGRLGRGMHGCSQDWALDWAEIRMAFRVIFKARTYTQGLCGLFIWAIDTTLHAPPHLLKTVRHRPVVFVRLLRAPHISFVQRLNPTARARFEPRFLNFLQARNYMLHAKGPST